MLCCLWLWLCTIYPAMQNNANTPGNPAAASFDSHFNSSSIRYGSKFLMAPGQLNEIERSILDNHRILSRNWTSRIASISFNTRHQSHQCQSSDKCVLPLPPFACGPGQPVSRVDGCMRRGKRSVSILLRVDGCTYIRVVAQDDITLLRITMYVRSVRKAPHTVHHLWGACLQIRACTACGNCPFTRGVRAEFPPFSP